MNILQVCSLTLLGAALAPSLDAQHLSHSVKDKGLPYRTTIA